MPGLSPQKQEIEREANLPDNALLLLLGLLFFHGSAVPGCE